MLHIKFTRDEKQKNIHMVIFIRLTPTLVLYFYDVTPKFTDIAAGTS